jgi:hypothetical protein
MRTKGLRLVADTDPVGAATLGLAEGSLLHEVDDVAGRSLRSIHPTEEGSLPDDAA